MDGNPTCRDISVNVPLMLSNFRAARHKPTVSKHYATRLVVKPMRSVDFVTGRVSRPPCLVTPNEKSKNSQIHLAHMDADNQFASYASVNLFKKEC